MSTGIQILESMRSLGVTVSIVGPNKDRLRFEPGDFMLSGAAVILTTPRWRIYGWR